MKKSVLFIAVLFISFNTFAQNEEEAIKEVINKAYIEGIHNKGEIKAIERGFHPGFNLLIKQDNVLEKLPIYNWVYYSKVRKEKDPTPLTEEQKTVCKFINIDVTGDAAVAKIELHRQDKLIFTDYLSLYKFNEGWKIVGKIYFKHE